MLLASFVVGWLLRDKTKKEKKGESNEFEVGEFF